MRRLIRLSGLAVTVLVLSGCFGSAASPSSAPSDPPSGTPTTEPSTSAPPSVAPSASATPASVEPIPSADLGEFSCELPVVESATVPLANIVDVRVGTHDDYDRVVFEFEQGLPEFTLAEATPPFTQDGSGAPVAVEGESFLSLTMRGGSKQTDEGTSSYDGPTDFDPGFATLVDLVEGGDFERQSTWYLGLGADACVRVMQLVGEGGAPRLVIDVEH